MARRIFVGDVQGCREELEELLEELAFDPAEDALHPVGDLVNRGPRSLETLRLLHDLGALPVLGNHDLHLLRVSQGLREVSPDDTIGDVLDAGEEADELLTWLANRPFALRFDDVLVVHAALHPAWDDPVRELAGLDPFTPDPRSDFATRVRECTPEGDLEGPGLAPWFEHYHPERHGDRTVVFGHWAARGRVELPRVQGLDTGCVWGGALTAWVPEEQRAYSVPARRAYAEIR